MIVFLKLYSCVMQQNVALFVSKVLKRKKNHQIMKHHFFGAASPFNFCVTRIAEYGVFAPLVEICLNSVPGAKIDSINMRFPTKTFVLYFIFYLYYLFYLSFSVLFCTIDSICKRCDICTCQPVNQGYLSHEMLIPNPFATPRYKSH